MKAPTLALFALATIAQNAETAAASTPLEYEQEFAQWLASHRLAFNEPFEYLRRLEAFVANDIFIRDHNERGSASFTLGHNEFSHLTFDEFASLKRGFQMPAGYLEQRRANVNATWAANAFGDDASAPESVDWVEKGAVTGVKNQGQCGSCWAFSTTGAVEGAAFVASGKLPNLSEQELVDCDHNGDNGCNGGLMDHAFQWIEAQGGICAESDYEYHAAVEQCRPCKQVVQVSGFVDVPPNNEKALKAAVAKQPVSVAIEADQREFQFYKAGVFDQACGTQLDHGVLVVGYGAEGNKAFWKVKNSWGPTWGESGYIRLARNLGPRAGQCGIAMVPSYPHASWVAAATPQGPVPERSEAIGGPFELEDDLGELVDLAVTTMMLELAHEVESDMARDVEAALEVQNEQAQHDGKVFEYIP
ncbi:hypothetical protein PybrP1_007982 [[Pythium] brassicae (nom. inval.)]|nr:hypothetical protein PybrP1_007982 [[Pythium] brassicae (nom. inval.)]